MLHLDTYCERAITLIWAGEPLNLVSNLGFLIAAALALRLFWRSQQLTLPQHWDLLLLIVLLAAIGVGSTLWHLLAEPWSLLADLIPILLFINLYLVSFLARVTILRWYAIGGLWVAYLALSYVVSVSFAPDALNGSLTYAPAWLALSLMTAWLMSKQHSLATDFAVSLGIWTISLALRTLDMQICGVLPIGTHFLWHLLNAIVLFLLLRSLMRSPLTSDINAILTHLT